MLTATTARYHRGAQSAQGCPTARAQPFARLHRQPVNEV
jgi:hypothetical protein